MGTASAATPRPLQALFFHLAQQPEATLRTAPSLAALLDSPTQSITLDDLMAGAATALSEGHLKQNLAANPGLQAQLRQLNEQERATEAKEAVSRTDNFLVGE